MDNNIKDYGEIRITDRKKIILTGVKKLVSYNPEEFIMESNLGTINLKGKALEIIKLDTVDQILSIKGSFNSLSYSDINKKGESIISRLFK